MMTNKESNPVEMIHSHQLPKHCQCNPNIAKIIRNEIKRIRSDAMKSNKIDAVTELFNVEYDYILKQQLTPSTNNTNVPIGVYNRKTELCHFRMIFIVVIVIGILIGALNSNLIDVVLGVRCFVPNNYLIWEATRPISDCSFCIGVQRPLILMNISRDEFSQHAYLSKPIIIKNAIDHWPARKQLTFQFLKHIYQKYPDELNRFDDECQFLPFKSSFRSLREFFEMSDEQIDSGKPSWYVGFSNCQSKILAELRQLYPKPHFLPDDAEIPNTDYTFLGYDDGAVMHLDYIPRLMWQAQLQGMKFWKVSPTPECDIRCPSFSFYVEPGDAVLIDTRIWYHGTSVKSGEFSMTIQSEYG